MSPAPWKEAWQLVVATKDGACRWLCPVTGHRSLGPWCFRRSWSGSGAQAAWRGRPGQLHWALSTPSPPGQGLALLVAQGQGQGSTAAHVAPREGLSRNLGCTTSWLGQPTWDLGAGGQGAYLQR